MKKTLIVLAAGLAAGSAWADHRSIKVDDNSTFLPIARLSADLSPRTDAPAVPHGGHGLEFAISGGSGNDDQSRRAGAPSLVFGGQTFASGVGLHHEFDFRFVEAAYRYRHFFNERFGIEALGGLGYAEYELTVSALGQRASDKLGSGGLVGGFGILWKFLPQTSLQSRLTLFGSGENEGVSGAARADVYVVHALGRNAALRAGLTSWGLVSNRDEDDDFGSLNSEIRARFSGISLGLDVAF